MTTTILNKKIEILNKYSVIPSRLNMLTDWQILDARGIEYEYGSYKYADNDEYHWNKVVSIQMKHKLMINPVWLTLFEGATYREAETQTVIVTHDEILDGELWKLNIPEDTIYSSDCITTDSSLVDGLESIIELKNAFDSRVFSGDESGLYTNGEEASIVDNCYVLSDVIFELRALEFVTIYETVISKSNPDLSKVATIENKLLEVAKGRLYIVTVVIGNNIEQYLNHLSKEEAEEKFIEYCKKYYNENGVEQFIADQHLDDIDNMSISDWESYFHSGAWYDIDDMANVQINLM